MRQTWHIAFIDIKLMVRDKTFFFWTLVFPLVFIFIFGNIYRGEGGPVKAELMVLNRDVGQWGAYFIKKLEAPGMDVKVLQEEPADYSRILVIPEDFSQKITGKKAQQLFFKKKESANVNAAAQAETKIIQAIAKIITELILYGDKNLAAFFEKKSEFRNIIQIKSQLPENTITKIPTGFDHVIPGILVQFIMMMVLIYGGIVVMTDRQRGILSRILYSSASVTHLWGGKFLARLMMGILQSLILIVTGILFFHLNLGNVFLSFLNVLIFSICISSLSILVGSVLKKEDLIVGVSVLLANLFAALAGCWWPIEVVPETFRTIGMISPGYWAMDAFHQVIFFNKGFSDIYINFIVLLGFTLLFTIPAIKFFKIKE